MTDLSNTDPQETDPGVNAQALIQEASGAVDRLRGATEVYQRDMDAARSSYGSAAEIVVKQSDQASDVFNEAYKNLEATSKMPEGIANLMSFLGNDKYNKRLQITRMQGASASLENARNRLNTQEVMFRTKQSGAVDRLKVAESSADVAIKKIGLVKEGFQLQTAELQQAAVRTNAMSTVDLQKELQNPSGKIPKGLLEQEIAERQQRGLQLDTAKLNKMAAETGLSIQQLQKAALDVNGMSIVALRSAMEDPNSKLPKGLIEQEIDRRDQMATTLKAGQLNLKSAERQFDISGFQLAIAKINSLPEAEIESMVKNGNYGEYPAGVVQQEHTQRVSARAAMEKASFEARVAKVKGNAEMRESANKSATLALQRMPTGILEAAMRQLEAGGTGQLYYGLQETKDGKLVGRFAADPNEPGFEAEFQFSGPELTKAYTEAKKSSDERTTTLVQQQVAKAGYAAAFSTATDQISVMSGEGLGLEAANPKLQVAVGALQSAKTAVTQIVANIDNNLPISSEVEADVQARLALAEQKVTEARAEITKNYAKDLQPSVDHYIVNKGRVTDSMMARPLLLNNAGNASKVFKDVGAYLQKGVTEMTTQSETSMDTGGGAKKPGGISIVQQQRVQPNVALDKFLSQEGNLQNMGKMVTGRMQAHYAQSILSNLLETHPAAQYLMDTVGLDPRTKKPQQRLKSSFAVATAGQGNKIEIIGPNGFNIEGFMRAMAVAEKQYSARLNATAMNASTMDGLQPMPAVGMTNLVDSFMAMYENPEAAKALINPLLDEMNPYDAAIYNVVTGNQGVQQVINQGGMLQQWATAELENYQQTAASAEARLPEITATLQQKEKLLADIEAGKNPPVMGDFRTGGGQPSTAEFKRTLKTDIDALRKTQQNIFQYLTGPQTAK